jgi:hypothetical protein
LIGGTIVLVGLVAFTGTEIVPGIVEDTFVNERVDVVVFKATMLVDE